MDNGKSGSYKSFKSKGHISLISDRGHKEEIHSWLSIILVLRKKNKKKGHQLEFYNLQKLC